MNSLQTHDKALLEHCEVLVGIDEAGRGCLAGPVVAGACVLKREFFDDIGAVEASGLINDSKQLSAESRARQYAVLQELQERELVDFAVAEGSVAEIAELNILGANRLAMRRAVEALAYRADWVLPEVILDGPLFQVETSVALVVDGRPLKPFPYVHRGIVKGDGKSLAIAMASIAAKVTRDRRMQELAQIYPEYGFEKHKGYATGLHRGRILEYGPCPEHRALFLRKLLA